jgi:hypothetical protein
MTFSEFKKNFYARVTHLEWLDVPGENVNLLKVVLDGLKVDYVKRGKVRAYMHWPYLFFAIYRMMKRFTSRQNSGYLDDGSDSHKKTKIIIDNGRIVKDVYGNHKSVYFENIKPLFSNEELLVVNEKMSPNMEASKQVHFYALSEKFQWCKLSKEENDFRKKLKTTYKKIKSIGLFNHHELANIKFAIHKFFVEYLVWKRFLCEYTNLDKAYFVCHYHKEGLILALKQAKIKCIELQHGLIAAQDIFYVFPNAVRSIKDKSLFADELWVYGTYWKNVVVKGSEYDQDQIKVIGYYLYEPIVPEHSMPNAHDNVLVITTQTTLHQFFIDFVIKLYENQQSKITNLTLVVKPHPAEQSEIYCKAFAPYSAISVVNTPINELFTKYKYNISVYSTTLFDALRFGVKNYVFMVPQCSDYVNEILAANIATLIDDDFSNFRLDHNTECNAKDDYYAAFNEKLFLS